MRDSTTELITSTPIDPKSGKKKANASAPSSASELNEYWTSEKSQKAMDGRWIETGVAEPLKLKGTGGEGMPRPGISVLYPAETDNETHPNQSPVGRLLCS